MSTISSDILSRIKGIVGEENVRADKRERTMYSFDIGTMPKLVSPFVPAGLAGAVVRPQSEEDLVALVQYANQARLSLVPRAWATSGYGGVLPPNGAIVVDLTAMQEVLEIDEAQQTVRVQAAAIWESVDRKIKKQGLTLRVYPSSYPSSSVGGWLAQGGGGFGSHEYGEFKESVVSARVVLPTGEIRIFSGEELKMLIADAEGITGFITEVTFKARKLEPETHVVLAFSSRQDVALALRAIRAQQLPVWSITFLNPESVRLKKQLPHRHGHPWEEAHPHFEPEIPEAYVVVLAYPERRAELIEPALAEIQMQFSGVRLSDEIAEHEWEQRFAPMRLKRLGPSVIPTEVIVPLDRLGATLDEIDRRIEQPFILEGMSVAGDKVVLLGFIPHDERSFAFNLAFALSLSVVNIAKQQGGSGFSTGLYFRREAASILGAEKVKQLSAFKRQIDPRNTLNPGKVLGSGFIDVLMGLASTFEPVIRPIANLAKPPSRTLDVSREIRGIPGDVALMAYSCARCGYCVNTCEQYSGRGWESQSPRGKYAYIREVVEGRATWDRAAVDTILVCTTCEVCNDRCQLQIPVEHNWMTLRGKLIHEEKRGTFPPFEMMAASLRGERDIWAGKAENRDAWVPEDVAAKIPEKGSTLYFAGCTASFVETDIAEATIRLLQDSGTEVSYMGKDEACCGIPMKMAGNWDLFEEIYEHNVAEARKRGADTIVTSCPACALVWKELYADIARKRGDEYGFEVKHYSEIVAPALADGTIKLNNPIEGTITFHDSCHMGRAQGIFEQPRDMLKAIPEINLVEMEHNREEGLCCGSVLTLVGEMAVAPVLGGHRLQEAVDAGADTVVALCPCCQVQLRDSNIKNDLGLKIDDLARVVAQAAGYDIPNTDEYSMYMWGYFEKFIVLMQPHNMAALMQKVFPQMLDAMPPGMKPMMLSMKHVPGGLALMNKMMPVMFPVLAPSILGKVMPDLIAAVEEHVGEMPQDMAELMPELLPETMEALMPTYLPELIPHLTPLFIDYIRVSA